MPRFVLSALLLASSTAWSADLKICVVDPEEAINQTVEGKGAQTKLETMFASREAEIEKKKKALEKEFQDYEARQAILSDEARRAAEEGLLAKREELQAFVYQAEQEMQSTYMSLLQGMEEKLMSVAQGLGAGKGCTILLNKAAVVYQGAGVTDLTADLVKAYDSK
jgi:Skp family chaperone for outer membrane proteins